MRDLALRLGIVGGATLAPAVAAAGLSACGIGMFLTPVGLACVAGGCCATGACAFAGTRPRVWAKLIALLPLVPLWTRFRPDEVLDHPTRALVLERLRAMPADVKTADLASTAGLNEGTLLYHLRFLAASGYVTSRRLGRDRVWSIAGRAPSAPAAEATRDASRRRILDEVERLPGLTQSALAGRVALSKSAVHHHVDRLVAAGLLKRRREGFRTRLFRV